MQPIDSTEMEAHGTSKDLACKKEETKCNNVTKYERWLTLMMLQNKT